MGITIAIFLGLCLHSLALCWSRQWGVVALLILVELSWFSLAGAYGLLSLYILDLTLLYLTALISILSGVELVLSLFAFLLWHKISGQSFGQNKNENIR